jgi:hypothetical protein
MRYASFCAHELRHLRKSRIEGRGIVAPGLGEVGASAAPAANRARQTAATSSPAGMRAL